MQDNTKARAVFVYDKSAVSQKHRKSVRSVLLGLSRAETFVEGGGRWAGDDEDGEADDGDDEDHLLWTIEPLCVWVDFVKMSHGQRKGFSRSR